jgi:hypothetical protein
MGDYYAQLNKWVIRMRIKANIMTRMLVHKTLSFLPLEKSSAYNLLNESEVFKIK